jgi:alkanesulfonate monooxygenase SsuD/methylene tetrahydromethanopterin reductase-like flavin-dependent oxidoreductase (luciferase family)
VTSGGPPIWIGGFADAVVRIAAREADAWNGWGMSISEFAGKARLLREEAEASGRQAEPTWAGIVVVGRDEDEVERMLDGRRSRGLEADVWAGTPPSLKAWIERLEEVGASWVVLVPGGSADRVELIAGEVLGRLGSRA